MVEFLVKKEANVHAVDKMKRTALILAVSYESMSVVSLLLQRGADVFSQDVFGRTAEEYAALSGFNIICQLISEYKEKRPKTPPEKSNPVDTSSEEDSLSRFSNKPGADSWPPSDDEVLDFETKHVPKPNLAKLLKAFQQSKRNEAECGPGVQGFPHPAFPRPDPLPKPLKTLAGLGLAQQSISESVPQTFLDHLPGDQRGKNTSNGQAEGVSFMPSCVSGLRNFKMAELGEPRHAGIAVAHAESPEKYPNVKPAVGVKDSVPNKTVGTKDPQTSNSDWDSTSLSLSSETCQRAGHLKADDRRPLVSQSVTKNQSAPTELGQKTATDKEKMKNAAMFLVGNSMPHHPGQSPLPENRESKQDLSGELDVEVMLEEEQEKLHGNENNDSQVEEEKKHKSSEVEVSDNVCDAADESRLSQQRKSGGNNKQEFPAMQNKGPDGGRNISTEYFWK
ncbi:ankyrin repeat domain-containing protein 26-like isoform X5 [Cervus elaphus]|uniref:ankyrin repeat domain-containing protein 26-like isoform X5 n=1 Tax=Cervus elaphus TaxID=9860 RepID=UPI001CC2E931|nr:ankyrin repeat domain-containing protein 26-like isoform X5 [Cervus elaphus]